MNNQDQLKVKISTPNWQRYVPAAMTMLVGIGLSLTVFAQTRAREAEQILNDFNDSLESTVSTLEHAFETDLLMLDSIGRFCSTTKVLERRGFREFVRPIHDQIDGIQALEWIPRVLYEERAAYEEAARQDGLLSFQFTERMTQGKMIPVGIREEYFPVYFVEPLKKNETALGFDLASNNKRQVALLRSRDTGQSIATARITLVQEESSQFGFLVFSPVYKIGMPVDTVQDRQNGLRGFVLAVFRLDDVIAAALVHLQLRDIAVVLRDMSATEDDRLLCHYVSDTRHIPSRADSVEGQNPHGPRQTVNFEVGGRQWSIECAAMPNFTAARSTWYPVGALVAGLSLTGLLGVYLLTGLGRAARMEAQVRDRTRTLREEVYERKQVEEELSRYHDHLEELITERTIELERSNAALRRANRLASIGTLAAGLGHDMSNVLLPARARLDVLAAQDLSSVAVDSIAEIRKSTQYLQQLADELRELAFDPEDVPDSVAFTDLTAWWDRTRPLLSRSVPKHVELVTRLDDDLPPVAIEAHKLTRVLLNLLLNASQAIESEGRIVVFASRVNDGESVRIGVSDNGCGMTQEVIQQALDPFFTTKKRGLGTGLGLSLVQGIVSDANGSLNIDSEPDVGTTVTITLLAEPDRASVDEENAKISRPRAEIHVSDPRIMSIVEIILTELGVEVVPECVPDGMAVLVVDPDACARIADRLADFEGRLVVLGTPPQHVEQRRHLVVQHPYRFEELRSAFAEVLQLNKVS